MQLQFLPAKQLIKHAWQDAQVLLSPQQEMDLAEVIAMKYVDNSYMKWDRVHMCNFVFIIVTYLGTDIIRGGSHCILLPRGSIFVLYKKFVVLRYFVFVKFLV